MPGTSDNFLTTKLTIGPGKFYTSVAVPAASARLTLHTDLTPESVANPSAVHVGFTDQGNKFTYTTEVELFEADEQTAPIFSRILTENAMIEGAMLQGADLTVLDQLLMAGTKASASGYEQITLGGNVAVTGVSVALIAPTVLDATKAQVINIYNAYNQNGLEVEITRRTLAKIPYSFKGLQVSSRAQGDRLCNYWLQVA